MNQSAPFWDFLASLEQQGNQHPFFSQNRNEETENENEDAEGYQGHEGPSQPFAPWSWGQFFGGPGGMAHRGGPPRGQHGPPHHGRHSHGPPPHHHSHHDNEAGEADQEKEREQAGEKDALMNDENDNGEGPSGNSGSDNEGRSHGRGHHGRCGGRRGRCGPGGPGGFGPRHGPPHHGPGRRHGPPHHGPPHHGRHQHGFGGPRGHHGPRGRHGPWSGFGGGPFGGLFDPSSFHGNTFDPSTIAAQFWNQFTDNHLTNKKDAAEPEDHIPEADIFDTETAFIVHVSLPGAKKEDVGVNWDAEKSELSIAGVIYRPGDEEFLKTLAMDERKVGAFDRKVRLGTRASPAHIDADTITAKLEDGVLRVEVPKLDSGYVEIRKVDIE